MMESNGVNVISIIIPAYNAEKYLSECLESVLTQDYSDIEILVINDGSTDNTQKLAESYAAKDSRIKVISIANRGVSVARNIGIENATGSYIMFIDADDALLQGALTYMLNMLQEYDADIVSGFGKGVPDGAEYDKNMCVRKEVSLLMETASLQYALSDRLAYAVWGKLYKREFLHDVRFPEGKQIHEDSLFLFRCFLKKCVYLQTYSTVYKHTQVANSLTHAAFDDRFLGVLDQMNEKLEMVKKYYPEFEELSYNLIVKTNMSLLINLCKTTQKKYRKIKKKAIRDVIKYKRYFVPTRRFHKQFFFVITHHLYGAFSVYYRLKYRKSTATKMMSIDNSAG